MALGQVRVKGPQTEAGRAVLALGLRVARIDRLLREAGGELGLAASWGVGGPWSLLATLRDEGPQTIAEAARRQRVARQRIQKLAQELRAEGLVAFRPNPAHRSAHLLVLTEEGRRRLAEVEAGLAALAERIGHGLDAGTLTAALPGLDALAAALETTGSGAQGEAG